MLEKSQLATLKQVIFRRINLSISDNEKYSFSMLNVGAESMQRFCSHTKDFRGRAGSVRSLEPTLSITALYFQVLLMLRFSPQKISCLSEASSDFQVAVFSET
ncbi:MAG: hypothetical protein J6M24_03750 [Lachnospiraceae bacterium]|nr:hypothetical protein [Lachnospiraceae bacterium]